MADVFAAVRALARYELLKAMPIDFFSLELGQALKGWDTTTLKDLCELGVEDLHRMGREAPYLLPAMMKLAQQLLLDAEEVSDSPVASQEAFVYPSTVGYSHVETFQGRKPIASQREQSFAINSVEAEQRLTKAIDSLQSYVGFAQVADLPLGKFWDPKFGSAPFEQSITFRQLREMRPRTLLEKRSFGPAKILGVVSAVEKALNVEVQAPATSSGQYAANVASAERLPSPEAVTPLWSVPLRALPSAAMLVLRFYESQLRRVGNEARPFARVVRALPESLTSEEFACLWLSQDFGEEVAAHALRLDATDFVALNATAARKVEAIFSAEAGELKGYWDIALRSPGVQLQRLIELTGTLNLDKDFVSGLVKVVVHALGARQPIAFGLDLSGYWTKNPPALQLNMSSLVAALPKTDSAVLEDFGALFPFIEPKLLRDVLSKLAAFNNSTMMWERRQ